MKDSDLQNLLSEVEDAARDGGRKIMEFFSRETKGWIKSDGSLVTEADHAAEALILSRLQALTPGIPIISEEAAEAGARPDISKGVFWVVDPLDGTEGFNDRTDNFVVAIALVAEGKPKLGVIYNPVTGNLFSAAGPGTATRTDKEGHRISLRAERPAVENPRILVNDASVNVPAVESYLRAQFNTASFLPDRRGTNLRAMDVAEGEADLTVIYPKRREGRTKWWDVAPAHAIIEAAGGSVEGIDGKPLVYDAEDYQVPQHVMKAKKHPDSAKHGSTGLHK